jgi:hypothetical protein
MHYYSKDYVKGLPNKIYCLSPIILNKKKTLIYTSQVKLDKSTERHLFCFLPLKCFYIN